MPSLMHFRRTYGSGPVHLLIMTGGFALLGYVVVTASPSTLLSPTGPWWKSIAVWFAAAAIAHDLFLFPFYALADRLLGPVFRRGRHRRETVIPLRNYLRVPALGSGLLLLIFFPDILRQSGKLYFEDTGLTQQPFLGRWLLLTAAMFTASAIVYAARLAMARLHRCAVDDSATAPSAVGR